VVGGRRAEAGTRNMEEVECRRETRTSRKEEGRGRR